jgi:hypothetical protein
MKRLRQVLPVPRQMRDATAAFSGSTAIWSAWSTKETRMIGNPLIG